MMPVVDNNQKHPFSTQNGLPFLIAHLNKNAIVLLIFYVYARVCAFRIYVRVDMDVCSFIEYNPM